MTVRIAELRNKNVVCLKNGQLLGLVSDIEIDIKTGNIEAIVILGRPRFLWLFMREEDIVIPWSDIAVIGEETVLVNSEPSFLGAKIKKKRNIF